MKKVRFFDILTIIFGLIFILGGIFFILHEKKVRDSYLPTTAEIVEIYEHYRHDDYEHDVYVTYEIDGVTYENVRLDSYKAGMSKGQTIKIYYDQNNPYKIAYSWSMTDLIIFPAIFMLFGGIAILIPLSIIIRNTMQNRKLNSLKETGRLIYAEVSGIVSNNVVVNGKHLVTIMLKDSQNNEYKIKTYQEDHPDIFVGNQVKVYVDPQDYSKYAIEL